MKYSSLIPKLLAGMLFSSVQIAMAVNYTVTNNSGSDVPGSLYRAVISSYYNSTDAVDKINFNIPGPGPHTITLTDASSNSNAGGTYYVGKSGKSVVIDATTQPGYNGQPRVYINANGNASCFYLGGGTVNTIAGFCIYNYTANAVTVPSASQGNFVQNNWLGFVPNGSGFTKNTDLGNATARGIALNSSYNVIRNNVISGVDNAITLGDDPTTFPNDLTQLYVTNSINTNFIGTTPDGNGIIGNESDGIFLGRGAAYNFLGPDNVISGQKSSGVELLHRSNYGNVIFRNRIGTNHNATVALGNGELGVLIAGGSNFNVVGGPFGGNVISGNSFGGVGIGQTTPPAGFAKAATIVYVQNNVIGLDGSATKELNTGDRQDVGVSIEGGSSNVIITGNFMGGHLNHSIQAFDSSLFNIESNALGAGVGGVSIPAVNGAGVYLQGCNTVYNTTKNFYGPNPLGNVLNNGSINVFP